MTVQQDFFSLFSLPIAFSIDRRSLDEHYRALQRTVHPDRFANAGDQERRMAMQQAAQINEGYRVLKDPLARGRYLLELQGYDLNDEQKTHQDPEFLMQQMELREALEEVRSASDPMGNLQALIADFDEQNNALTESLASALGSGDMDKAYLYLQRMQFFRKLAQEAEELEADLEDY